MIAALALALALRGAQPPPRPICRSETHCAAVAREAMPAADLARAERAAMVQLHFEECSEGDGPRPAVDTLARIALRRGQPLLARAWLAEKGGRAATRRAAEAAIARLPPASGLSGLYRWYRGAGVWNSAEVRQLAPDRVRFSLSAFRLSNRRCEHALDLAAGDFSFIVGSEGGMDGEAVRKGTDFVFETREDPAAGTGHCVISLHFADDALTVAQDGSSAQCGFGYEVDAAGDYVRTGC